MRFHGLNRIGRSQKGFTLIEMIMAIVVASILGGGIIIATFQVIDVNARSTAHMVAIKEVSNAVHWITRDAQMAQDVVVTATSPFPLTMSWTNTYDSPATSASVTYSVVSGKLQRVYTPDIGTPSTTVVAEHIDSDPQETNWSFSGYVFTFKITATVVGSRLFSESRSFDVLPRPVPMM